MELGETIEYTREILPSESLLARKIARDSLGPIANSPATLMNCKQRSNCQNLGDRRSTNNSVNFKISSAPLLSPIQDEGSFQSSESAISTSNASSDASCHNIVSYASQSQSSVNNSCIKTLPGEEISALEASESITLKSCQRVMNQSFKVQILEAMANSTKVDSFNANADEGTFCILPEAPVELGNVSEFELVKTIGTSKKMLVKNIYGESFVVNTQSTFRESSINSVLKNRLKKLNLNYNIGQCLPSQISLIHSACSEYCSFINVSNSVSFADVIDKFNKSDKSFSEVHLAIITAQLISVLETIHKCNVILTSVDLHNVWLKLSERGDQGCNYSSMSRSSCVLYLTGLHNSIDMSLFQLNQKFLVDDSADSFGCLQSCKGQFLAHSIDILSLGCCVAALLCGDSSFKYDKELNVLTVLKEREKFDHALWADFLTKTMKMKSNYTIGLLPNLREKFEEFLGKVNDAEYKKAIDTLSSLLK